MASLLALPGGVAEREALAHVELDLADDEWATALTEADRRGLTPLFWTHVAPYGEVRLDMTRRLVLAGTGGLTTVGEPVVSPR